MANNAVNRLQVVLAPTKEQAAKADLMKIVDAAIAELSEVKPKKIGITENSAGPKGEVLMVVCKCGYTSDVHMKTVLNGLGYKAYVSKDVEVAHGEKTFGDKSSVSVIYLPTQKVMVITAHRYL